MSQTILHRVVCYAWFACIFWLIHVCTEIGIYSVQLLHKILVFAQLQETIIAQNVQQYDRIGLCFFPSLAINVAEKVLRLRFGLEDGRSRTLEEVGKEFNVTRERIRQIEAKALRKLRHPSRSRKLKDYLD